MQRKIANGAKANRESKKSREQPKDLLLRNLLSLARDEKKQILYKLLCDLLGKSPEEEAWIYDPQGRIYAHLLPPALRAQIQLLEGPELAAVLERCSATAGPTRPFKEIVRHLKAQE